MFIIVFNYTQSILENTENKRGLHNYIMTALSLTSLQDSVFFKSNFTGLCGT